MQRAPGWAAPWFLLLMCPALLSSANAYRAFAGHAWLLHTISAVSILPTGCALSPIMSLAVLFPLPISGACTQSMAQARISAAALTSAATSCAKMPTACPW